MQCPRCRGTGQLPAAESLRPIRHSAGLTLTAMARSMGVSVPYLSDVERGKRHVTARVEKAYRELQNQAASDAVVA